MDFFKEVDRANSAWLAANGFGIPASVQDVHKSVEGWPFENVYCWECGSRENVSGRGRLARCGGCGASERQMYREEAAREREYERDDDE